MTFEGAIKSNAANGGMLVPVPTMIETATGRFIDLLNPDPQDIDPRDIAHALSMMCRYGGHTKRFYSVAEHSVLVHDLLRHQGHRGHLLKAALLHDAAEAYLGDIPSPLKYALRKEQFSGSGLGRLSFQPFEAYGGAYYALSERMDCAIAERFCIKPPYHDDALKIADLWALRIEAAELMPSAGNQWCWEGELPYDGKLPLGVSWAGGHLPVGAESLWWARYATLGRD